MERYSRQIILEDVGEEGQKALMSRSVVVVGVGGLGSSCVMYLATCGIGTLGLVDMDQVDVTNLHRQVIHSEKSKGMNKAKSASKRCLELNSSLKVRTYESCLNEDNAIKILQDYDIVVDCTDNPTSRYLINDSCVLLKKPLVSGSSVRMDGQLTVYNYLDGPCYRCLFPKPPPKKSVMKCSEFGVLGVVPGIIGCLQALEVQKLILHKLHLEKKKKEEEISILPLYRKLLIFDARKTLFRIVKLRGRKENCPVCGKKPTITEIKHISLS